MTAHRVDRAQFPALVWQSASTPVVSEQGASLSSYGHCSSLARWSPGPLQTTNRKATTMAHLIEEHDQMASANGITPWHQLGVVVDGTMDIDSAIRQSGLDWTVDKRQVYVLDDNGLTVPVDGAYSTCRIPNDDGSGLFLPLGTVGERYVPIQNREGFDVVGALADDGDIEIETAGSLRNCRTTWVLAKVGDSITVHGEEHVPYLLFYNTHDGQGSQALFTPTRVVCANTLDWAIKGQRNRFTFRHTGDINAKLAEARTALKMSFTYMDDFAVEVEDLMRQDVTDAEFERLVNFSFPFPEELITPSDSEFDNIAAHSIAVDSISNRKRNSLAATRGKLKSIWDNDDRIGEHRNSGWGAVQTFSTYDLWERKIRGGERDDRTANRLLSGDTARSLNVARELVAAL